MNRSFGSRLFWLLLLFASVPAIIMAIAGYYLASQTDELTTGESGSTKSSLVKYYNDLLYARISEGLVRFEHDRILEPGLIDFSFSFYDSLTHGQPIPYTVREAITVSARQQTQGWVEVEDIYYQYALQIDSKDTLCGGLIHGQAFSALAGSVDEERSAVGINRILQREYLVFLLLLFALLVTITTVAAYILAGRSSRRLAKPLEDLASAAGGIARGKFDQRVALSGDREIRQLIESFNSMASQLDQITQRLAQSERVAAWRQVARRFAHELKNPIQPILISLYRIEKKLTDTDLFPEVSQPLKAATEELNHLVELAERFSSLAKLPQAKLESVDLTQVVKSIGELYWEELIEYDFNVELPDQSVYAHVDETSLREALHNIILNARDACATGSLIELALCETDDSVEIVITDRGEGMDRSTLSAARLPYFTTKAKGSGLGLAIVERSVNEMDGRLLVFSSPGRGTTVKLVFSKDRVTGGNK